MPRTTDSPQAWSRRRLLGTLTAVALVSCLLLGGFGYAIFGAVTSDGGSASANPATPDGSVSWAAQMPGGDARRDAIAAAPMLQVSPSDSRGGVPDSTPGPSIVIPPAGQVGPQQVPTGYPPTPEGALGQLAAIEVAVLASMSIDTAHRVHDAWAAPGAPGAARWALTANIQAFLASNAGQSVGERPAAVVVTPVAAQVKGTDGPDWVLGCVLTHVTATVVKTARIAYGHCERMAWTGDRWVIAPGAAPAPAPSTWPGTALARQAGWLTWTSSSQG